MVRRQHALPRYPELFEGYGANKFVYTLALTAAGYRFEVLPGSWVIHLPHGKSAASTDFVRSAEARRHNRLLRFRYVAELRAKYRIGACRRPHEPVNAYRAALLCPGEGQLDEQPRRV